MGQMIDPVFAATINSRAYAALGVPRRNAGNTGYEFARAGFPDTAQTWEQTQTFTVAPVFTDDAGTRTALGLGSLATQSGTFSGTSSGSNTGDQTVFDGGSA